MNEFDERFYLIYQPIVRFTSETKYEVNEYEVLLRSKKTDRFPVEDFQQIIHSDQLNKAFFDWYGGNLIEKIKKIKNICFSINFHPDQWRHPSTLLFLKKMTPYKEKLVIELTEHFPTGYTLKEYQTLITTIHRLGYPLAVDDVGTGVNSLAFLLQNVEYISRLKFSLIHFGSLNPAVLESFVHSWIQFSEEYEKEFVIEGIDCIDTSRELRQKGIVLQQGYLFGKGSKLV